LDEVDSDFPCLFDDGKTGLASLRRWDIKLAGTNCTWGEKEEEVVVIGGGAEVVVADCLTMGMGAALPKLPKPGTLSIVFLASGINATRWLLGGNADEWPPPATLVCFELVKNLLRLAS